MAGKSKPWDGTPLLMLVGGPRHGWVYKLSDYENRGGHRSSFDDYSPMHRRGGELVMSTIGKELPHYETADPAIAATPVQLWSYIPAPAEPVAARTAASSTSGRRRHASATPARPAVPRPAREPFVECPECSRPGARSSVEGRAVYRCAEDHSWPAPEVARHLRSVDL